MSKALRQAMALPRLDDDRNHLRSVLTLVGGGERSADYAFRMIDEAGSLGAAVSMSAAQLDRLEVPLSVARKLSVLKAAHSAALRRIAAERPLIDGCGAALDYLHATMAHLPHEVFRVLFLDCRRRLIRDDVMGSGTVTRCSVYPREVVVRALQLSASHLVLVHNHPSGALEPSRDDIVMTKSLTAAAIALDICVDEHLIIGRGGYFSFRDAGLISAEAVDLGRLRSH